MRRVCGIRPGRKPSRCRECDCHYRGGPTEAAWGGKGARRPQKKRFPGLCGAVTSLRNLRLKSAQNQKRKPSGWPRRYFARKSTEPGPLRRHLSSRCSDDLAGIPAGLVFWREVTQKQRTPPGPHSMSGPFPGRTTKTSARPSHAGRL